jgi:hypothetical protein
VFAAAYASEPLTDMSRSGDAGGVDWRPDVDWKWGRVVDDLPVSIEAPGDWATSVARYAGTGVYTWQDHASQIVSRRGDDAVPFGVAHGTRDDVVEWPTQGEPFYPALTASSRCVGGAIRAADHTWLGFDGLPATLAADASLVPFAGLRVVRDETVPGLGPDAASPAWPPGGEVDLGTGIAWSASWDAWAGPPVDLETQWSMALRAVDGSAHVVDLTPRRLQRFVVRPGLDYGWQIVTLDGHTLGTGIVSADADGLLTVPGVPIDEVGVRVTITAPGA